MKRIAPVWLGGLIAVMGWVGQSLAEQRFPPPDFESGYKVPATVTQAPRGLGLEYLDVAVLLVALGLSCYFVLKLRSRRAVFGLSLFSLAYFGFYRQGCICAIGSVQNVTLGLFERSYAVPLTALAFFVAPLVVALFAGRAFCAAVCPHGALQDLVLLKPVKVPAWLEHGLGLIPFIYLGAGVAFAATGTAFVICRYDPFVPLFRRSGSLALLLAGGAFLLVGMFVGRPYCRFLCPYGALLKLGAAVSKFRVTITPNICTQCRLCENACPYGAIQEPVQIPIAPQGLRLERRRLGLVVLLLPILVALGAWLGSRSSVVASRYDPVVSLAERYLREKKNPVPYGLQTAPALALHRAEQDPQALLTRAVEIRQRYQRAGWWFGGWVGLVIALKLVALSVRQRRTDYEPDRGNCVSCARCFSYCPNERARCGLSPSSLLEAPLGTTTPESAPSRAPAPGALVDT